MVSVDTKVEKDYYDKFYESGEYAIRKVEDLTEEQKYLQRMINKYNCKRNKRCLEIGSGGGSYRI